MRGLVFDIKHFAVHDGPGIRSTVFLKGCPLSCAWCHNPEGITPEIVQVQKEFLLDARNHSISKTIGEFKTPSRIINELKEYQIFYEESGGGITFSGGEPMHQINFLEELLIQSKSNGWHTAIDTSGYVQWDSFQRILPHTDLFLFDLKHLNSDLHQQETGAPNRIILENLSKLCEQNANLIIRIPLIPGFNDSPETIAQIGQFLKNLKIENLKIDLLPFHATGKHKYIELGYLDKYKDVKSLNPSDLSAYKQILNGFHFDVNIGG